MYECTRKELSAIICQHLSTLTAHPNIGHALVESGEFNWQGDPGQSLHDALNHVPKGKTAIIESIRRAPEVRPI